MCEGEAEQCFGIIDICNLLQFAGDEVDGTLLVRQAEHLRSSKEDEVPIFVAQEEDWIAITQMSVLPSGLAIRRNTGREGFFLPLGKLIVIMEVINQPLVWVLLARIVRNFNWS